jgi:cell division protein FtsB
VFAVVGGLYLQHAISFLSTRARAQAAQAYVHQLVQANHRLEREQRSLQQPATILARARELGMVRAGERPYVVTGLPGR